MTSFRVMPQPNGRWGVCREGSDEASEVYWSEEAATVRAEQLVRISGGGELVVTDATGAIRERTAVAPGPGSAPARSPDDVPPSTGRPPSP
jgi:hypothetical protein